MLELKELGAPFNPDKDFGKIPMSGHFSFRLAEQTAALREDLYNIIEVKLKQQPTLRELNLVVAGTGHLNLEAREYITKIIMPTLKMHGEKFREWKINLRGFEIEDDSRELANQDWKRFSRRYPNISARVENANLYQIESVAKANKRFDINTLTFTADVILERNVSHVQNVLSSSPQEILAPISQKRNALSVLRSYLPMRNLISLFSRRDAPAELATRYVVEPNHEFSEIFGNSNPLAHKTSSPIQYELKVPGTRRLGHRGSGILLVLKPQIVLETSLRMYQESILSTAQPNRYAQPSITP